MTNFPEWWFWVSGIFFALNILFFIGLLIALVKIVGVIKGLQPKIEQLTTKVEAVTEKVNDLTTAARATVDNVGGKAKSVAGSIERITHTASTQFEKFSPILIGGMTVLKLLSAFQQYRQAHAKPAPEPEEEEDDEE